MGVSGGGNGRWGDRKWNERVGWRVRGSGSVSR